MFEKTVKTEQKYKSEEHREKANHLRSYRRKIKENLDYIIGKKEIPKEKQTTGKIKSLRCMKIRKIKQADQTEVEKQCQLPAVNGSTFCNKHHGGNSNALKTGKHSKTTTVYRGAFANNLKDVLTKFIEDPAILDLKPELAGARTILTSYIKKMVDAKPKTPKKFCRTVTELMMNGGLSEREKYEVIKNLVEEQETIMSGKVIDRINRTIDTIGRTVERINKVSNKDEYILTPDGLKVFLRSIIEIIRRTVTEKEIQDKIREELLNISTITGGNVSNVNRQERKEEPIDAEFTEIKNDG